MKSVIIRISLVFTLTNLSFASLSKLSDEYINSGSDNESKRMDLQVNELNKDLIYESRPWVLTAESSAVSSKLETSTSLPSDYNSTLFEVGIAKEFVSGTRLSFNNSLTDYDNNLSATTNNSGFSQSLTLTQDLWKNFLGRNDRLDREIADKTFAFQEKATEATISGNLFVFVNEYLQIKVSKAIVELQKLTVKRAKDRLSLIQRRVRDGLSEKVDLYSAQTRDFAAKENLRTEQINLESNLESLSKKLHRRVLESEVEAYKIQIESELSKVEGNIEENQDLQASLEKIKYLSDTFNQKENTTSPSLSLAGSYSTNNYQASGSPISDGILGTDDRELAIGLTLSWNIGSVTEKISKESSSIELNKAKMINRNQLLTLKQQEVFLSRRIIEVENLLEIALKRLKIANKTLKEYNRLYKRGRANLDQVIRSEEDLITTQVSYVRYLVRRDNYYASQAFLYGKLNKAIFK